MPTAFTRPSADEINDEEQTLRSFLELLSAETVFPTANSEKQPSSGDNDENVTNNRNKVLAFLRDNTVNDLGTSLSMPSLSCADDLFGTRGSSGQEKIMPNALLDCMLKKGNPFPPKASNAKGKKKLLKRRSSARNPSVLAAMSSAAVIVSQEELKEKMGYNSPAETSAARIGTLKAQILKEKIARTIKYASCTLPLKSDLATDVRSPTLDNNQNDDTSKMEDTSDNPDLFKALNTLHENLNGTVQNLLRSQLITLLSALVYKSIRISGSVSKGASQILASITTTEISTEEADQQTIEKSFRCLKVKEVDDKNNKVKTGEDAIHKPPISAGLQDRNGSPETNDSKKGKTEEGNRNLGHVSDIKKIEDAFSCQISYSDAEPSTRYTNTTIEKCTTSFSLSPSRMDTSNHGINNTDCASSGKKTKRSLLFGAEMQITIMGNKAAIEFGTSGHITGDFDELKLANATISLDLEGLFKSIVREINKSLKVAIESHQRKKKDVPTRRPRLSRRELNLRAAQTLLEPEVEGAPYHPDSRITLDAPSSKRRFPSGSRGSIFHEPTKRGRTETSDPMESVAEEMIRLAREGRKMGTSDISGSLSQGQQQNSSNFGMMEIGAMLAMKQQQDGNSNNSALLAEAIRNAGLQDTMNNNSLFGGFPMPMAGGNAMSMNGSHGGNLMAPGGNHDGNPMTMVRGNEGNPMTMAEANGGNPMTMSRTNGGNPMTMPGANEGNSMLMQGASAANAVRGATNMSLGRSNMDDPYAAAAEALRLAEAGNSMSGIGGTNRDMNELAFNSAIQRSNYGDNSLSQSVNESARLLEMENALNALRRNSRPAESMTAAAELLRRGSFSNNSMGPMDAMQLAGLNGGSNVPMSAALTASGDQRSNNFNNERANLSGGNGIVAAAEASRMLELESALRNNATRRTSFSRNFSSDMNDPLAAEALRLADMQMRQTSTSVDPMAASTETLRAADFDPRKRRSSLSEAIRLVEMDALRRSSAGMSMASAAEAVRLSDESQRSHTMMSPSNTGRNRLYSNNCESVDSLSALLARRSSAGTGSMLNAAEAVRLAELESWARRRSSGPSGSMAAAAAELAAETENDLIHQAARNPPARVQTNSMRTSSGRRVSFGPDTLRDQVSRFRRGP